MLERYAVSVPAALLLAALGGAVMPAAQPRLDGQHGHSRSRGVRVVDMSIQELQASLTAGRTTSRALVGAYLARIEAYDDRGPALNAISSTNPEALVQADALDAERRAKKIRGPLHGMPIIVKDNYETREMPTTAGSILLEGWMSSRDAFLVTKLREAGAIVLAKSHMHELAYGIETVGSLFGQTRNPYALDRNPGGSSGGTGSAVAASFAAAGLGSDTCGSIRIPASHNNIVGIRPTQGLTSRAGIVPLAHTQDIGGPLGRTVADVAILLDALAGYDPADPVTAEGVGHPPATYTSSLRADGLKGARIGALTDLFGSDPLDAEVAAVVRSALDAMKQQGAAIVDVASPGLLPLLKDASVIREELEHDLNAFLAAAPKPPVTSLDEIVASGRYHPILKERLTGAQAVTERDSKEYLEKLVRHTTIRRAALKLMADGRVDALAYPTIRRKAALLGESQAGSNCALSATSGLPSITVPAGFTPDGLPVGIELLGRQFGEPGLFRLAYSFEQATRHRRAPASTPELR